MKTKKCLECNTILEGRSDKKFCNQHCKSSYYYQKNKNEKPSIFQEINKQLKLNRKILKKYNKSGLSTVQKSTLIKEGFNPKYFTHYWKNQRKQVYLFCYEFGFIERTETNKYTLIQWQKYMKK